MQEKKCSPESVVDRLRRYQVSQGLPWYKVAEKLGVSRGMIMMVLRGDRRLSDKALFRLELAEREVADQRSVAERFVESAIGKQDLVAQVLGKDPKKTVEIPVEYKSGMPSKSFPGSISLLRPSEENCRKIKALFAETLDTRLVALACLPKEVRNEGFINRLTPESRTRLTNAALSLVLPDWRDFVTAGM